MKQFYETFLFWKKVELLSMVILINTNKWPWEVSVHQKHNKLGKKMMPSMGVLK